MNAGVKNAILQSMSDWHAKDLKEKRLRSGGDITARLAQALRAIGAYGKQIADADLNISSNVDWALLDKMSAAIEEAFECESLLHPIEETEVSHFDNDLDF